MTGCACILLSPHVTPIATRFIDESGKLHSRRLLTISGNLPSIFRPFVPVRSVYMLEDVVVDAAAQTMEVNTRTITLTSVVEAISVSHYEPEGDDGTRYSIDITVRAFPRKARGDEEKAGYIASKLEKWTLKKLAGNVSKGKHFIDTFCRQHVAMCEGRLAARTSEGVAAASVMQEGGRLSDMSRGNGLLSQLLGIKGK